MPLTYDEVGRIWVQAIERTGFHALAQADAYRTINERVMAEFGPPDLDLQVRSLLERAAQVASRTGFFARGAFSLRLTDLAPEAVGMFLVIHDAFVYITEHWDTLPHGNLWERWKPEHAADIAQQLVGEALQYGEAIERQGFIIVSAQRFTMLQELVGYVHTLLLGDEAATRIFLAINEALAHLRVHIRMKTELPPSQRPS